MRVGSNTATIVTDGDAPDLDAVAPINRSITMRVGRNVSSIVTDREPLQHIDQNPQSFGFGPDTDPRHGHIFDREDGRALQSGSPSRSFDGLNILQDSGQGFRAQAQHPSSADGRVVAFDIAMVPGEKKMCVVSMIGDHYRDKWIDRWPNIPAWPAQSEPPIPRGEFEALKREVQELKELLKRAKEYDERNGEPDCEIDDKMALLKRVAEAVGIDLDEVLKPKRAKAAKSGAARK